MFRSGIIPKRVQKKLSYDFVVWHTICRNITANFTFDKLYSEDVSLKFKSILRGIINPKQFPALTRLVQHGVDICGENRMGIEQKKEANSCARSEERWEATHSIK